MNSKATAARFEGRCPFTLCHETHRHEHPICPACGSVWHRNLACPVCLAHWGIVRTVDNRLRLRHTHYCDSCPPAPGPDYPGDLCGKCQDEVWDDWGHAATTGELD